MYQVLQVYKSVSLFDNFLSRSIKVGQSSSRRDVAVTLRRCRRNFSSIIWSRAGLGDVVETSSSSKTYLVAATSPRTGDLKKSPKSRRKNRTCLISPRLHRDPPNLQEKSKRRRLLCYAERKSPSHQLDDFEIVMLISSFIQTRPVTLTSLLLSF